MKNNNKKMVLVYDAYDNGIYNIENIVISIKSHGKIIIFLNNHHEKSFYNSGLSDVEDVNKKLNKKLIEFINGSEKVLDLIEWMEKEKEIQDKEYYEKIENDDDCDDDDWNDDDPDWE